MDAIECIKTRRSIRKFKPEPVPRKLVMEVIDCGRRAPSSRNSQPWQFIVITSDKQKEELAAIRRKTSVPCDWMADAPALVAVCVDLEQCSPTRWIETGSVAAENILLAAHAKGLGACWIAMRYDFKPQLNARIQSILGVGANVMPVAVLALGYPDEEPKPKQLRDIHSMVR